MKKLQTEYMSRMFAVLSGACMMLVILTILDNTLGLGMAGFAELSQDQKLTIFAIMMLGLLITMLYPFVPIFYKKFPRLHVLKHSLYLGLGIYLACMIAQGTDMIVTTDKVIMSILETIVICMIGIQVYKDLNALAKCVK